MPKHVIQGIVISSMCVTLAIGVYFLARRQVLSFRYAVGWLTLLGLGALSSLLVPLSEPLAEAIGVTPGVIVSAVAVLTLVAICVQLSISISGLQRQVRALSEELALHRVLDDEHAARG